LIHMFGTMDALIGEPLMKLRLDESFVRYINARKKF